MYYLIAMAAVQAAECYEIHVHVVGEDFLYSSYIMSIPSGIVRVTLRPFSTSRTNAKVWIINETKQSLRLRYIYTVGESFCKDILFLLTSVAAMQRPAFWDTERALP